MFPSYVRSPSSATARRAALIAAATIAAALSGPPSALAELKLLPSVAAPVTTYRGSEYFVGGTGRLRGLYRNDGPQASTTRVARVEGRASPDYTRDGLFVVRDQLVFTATSAYRGTGFLMRSDGTARGTRRVLKAQARADGQRTRKRRLSVGRPIVAGDQLFVNVDEGAERETLSRVDLDRGTLTPVLGDGRGGGGVAAGPAGLLFTAMALEGPFQELWNAPDDGKPIRLASTKQSLSGGVYGEVGDRLYFTGIDAEHGAEPWVTDGTPAGTHLVADLTPGGASTDVSSYATEGGAVYATASAERDALSGRRNAYLLTGPGGPGPVTADGAPIQAGPAVVAGDEVWFATRSGSQVGRVRVAAGSTMGVTVPGPAVDENGVVVVPGGPLYASANTLRSTDTGGVTTVLATTGRAANSKAGPEPAITGLTQVGKNAWFQAPVADGGGALLWRSDGTVAGTNPVVRPGQISPVPGSVSVRRPPARDARAPYVWTISGTLTVQGIQPDAAEGLCRGNVVITTSRSGSSASLHRERAPVRWSGTSCTFRRNVAPGRAVRRAGRGKLVLQVAFAGTDHVASTNRQRFSIRYPSPERAVEAT